MPSPYEEAWQDAEESLRCEAGQLIGSESADYNRALVDLVCRFKGQTSPTPEQLAETRRDLEAVRGG